MAFTSSDGRWKVRAVTIDGVPLLRVCTPDPLLALACQDGRPGLERTADGWLVAHVTSAGDVARYTSLAELQEGE